MRHSTQQLHTVFLSSVRSAVVFLVASLSAGSSRAELNDFGLTKGVAYQQTSLTQLSVVAAEGEVGLDDDGFFGSIPDFTTANATTTSALSPFDLVGQPASNTFFGSFNYPFDKSYSTVTALDAAFPTNAVYHYTVGGGTLGTQTASLVSPATDLFPAAPMFNGFNQLQEMNAAAPFEFTWNGYTPAPGITDTAIYLDIIRVSDGQSLGLSVLASGDSTLSSYLLPANTLQPGTNYDAVLTFTNDIFVPNAGFGGASSFVEFDTRTDVTFRTAPEPSSLVLGAAGASMAVGLTLRRKRGRPQCP